MSRDTLPLEGLDLNLLVTLRALLRESSVTRAAERLGQTQPTVSRALATLRHAFDDPLLVRSGRGMAPTPLAQSLRTPLERCLASLDRLRSVGEFDPTQDERVFRLTMPDLLGTLLLPPLAEHLCQQAPGVSLQVVGTERDALRTLLEDEVDLVVTAMSLDHPELYSRRARGPGSGWSVLCGPLHPSHGEDMDLETWLASEHVQFTPGGRPDVPSAMDEFIRELGSTRTIRMSQGYLSSLGHTLARTPWVTSLPTLVADHVAEGQHLHVSPHPLSERFPNLSVRLVWHEVHHADPGHAWLRGLLGRLMDEMGA